MYESGITRLDIATSNRDVVGVLTDRASARKPAHCPTPARGVQPDTVCQRVELPTSGPVKISILKAEPRPAASNFLGDLGRVDVLRKSEVQCQETAIGSRYIKTQLLRAERSRLGIGSHRDEPLIADVPGEHFPAPVR